MKLCPPDYSNSIVNLSNSILKYFTGTQFHEGLEDLDLLLKEKQYKHVVLMVNDGLGYDNIQELLPETSFLRRHLVRPISSVFPPTTTAATTSLQSGLSPSEHGWMGWNVYVPQVDNVVTLFLSQGKSVKKVYETNVGKTYLAYENLYHVIPKTSDAKAYGISPFEMIPYDFNEPDDLYRLVESYASLDETNYIYAYYDRPDAIMHRYGTQAEIVKENVRYINDQIEALSKKLKDTLIIVTADHGLLDIENLFLEDYPDITKMLAMETSLEPRSVNFFIKEEFQEAFPKVFNQHFGGWFQLLSKQEVIDQGLFGKFKHHPNFDLALGDYLAIATDAYALLDTRSDIQFKAHHAGMTQKEMRVPLILIDCK